MSLEQLIKLAATKIASAACPVSFSGAGLSAESGIATFRDTSDKQSHWSRFDPQELASQQGFLASPDTVIDWYNWRRQILSSAKPNNAHLTLAGLEGWTHITQNVDNLLEVAGASVEQVLHLHGTLLEDRCNANCGHSEKIELSNSPALRSCVCGNYMRPSVVWFGESLPEHTLTTALEKTEKSDLMLVVGTSAQVHPAAGLIDIAVTNGAEVIIVNKEPSSIVGEHVTELVGPAGQLLPQLFQSV